jgi:hypothetical protein
MKEMQPAVLWFLGYVRGLPFDGDGDRATFYDYWAANFIKI